jgi:hypothetical protein
LIREDGREEAREGIDPSSTPELCGPVSARSLVTSLLQLACESGLPISVRTRQVNPPWNIDFAISLMSRTRSSEY